MGMYFLRISPAIYGKVSGFLPTIKLGGTSSSAEGVVKDLVSEEPEGQKAKKEKT
jgi:hypothetical protein